ncbi:MAG: cysteine--tRNA ligase [Candidatus Omnitrophica bacterium]|nr:cysteine--tRNA ligase [Candidatus Omnitrophota bacterium]
MPEIKFFNTLSGKLEEFKPLKDKEVSLYTCGPTVYDYAHIGNFRTFVFEDLLRRFLEFKGYKVNHIMNITDVDDKTIAGAKQKGQKLNEYTEFYTQAFHEDLKTLNILPPTKEPKATEEIPAMIELIEKLYKSDKAYVNDGSVYYRIIEFSKYGKLSKKNLEKNIAGASERVDVDEYDKEHVTDFVLWKKAKEDEPSWDSPWGKGRPGWHIECSAMSMKYLGETFDIHAGGEDLIFPHHENEIAQSEGATGKEPFVRYWLHSKHLLVDGKKMSKKDKNFYTLRDLLAIKDEDGKQKYDGVVIRFSLLFVHYRQQFNFTLQGLDAAKEALKRLRDFWLKMSLSSMKENNNVSSLELGTLVKLAMERFTAALADDLNTSEALGEMFAFIKLVNKISPEKISAKEYKEADAFLNETDNMLGIFSGFHFELSDEIKEIVKLREEARKGKKYDLADSLRNEARKKGYLIDDLREGARVKKLL